MKPVKNVVSAPPNHHVKRWLVIIFGIFFILLGIASILIISISVGTNDAVQSVLEFSEAQSSEKPSLIMVFLVEFGIILPVLAIGAGMVLIWLGIKIFSGHISFGHWAQVILLWLAIGAMAVFAFNLIQFISRLNDPTVQEVSLLGSEQFIQLIGLAILSLLLGGSGLWLKLNITKFFAGQELLKDAEVRFAWNLLIPTLIVLIFVAGRPLEQTFIRSLTDKVFAGQGVPNFVGFDNYINLLSTRFDVVNCRLDENTGECLRNPNGSLSWETIDRELLKEGFRSVWTIKIPFREETAGLTISGLDKDFIESIWTTLLFSAISVTLELLLAMFIALTVNSRFKGRGLMRAVMLVPWAIPTAISARLWESMLKATSAGFVNKFLMDLNLISEPKAWLATPALQIPSAIMVDVWKTAPFMALLLLAGLQTISEDLYEAASVDGANDFQKFFSITLPLMRPTISVALVFRTLDALRVFDLFNVLFSRQQLTMATYNYEMLVGSQKDGYASAISLIIFLFISVFAIIYVRMLNVETQ